jgi:hypothetical protein
LDLTNGVLGQNSKPARAVKFANPSAEIKKLLEVSFEYMVEKDELIFFRKRK